MHAVHRTSRKPRKLGPVALLLLLLAMATTACTCDLEMIPDADWPQALVADENAMLERLNADRAAGATCGDEKFPPVPPLTLNADLRTAARYHSQHMATHDFFDHDDPDNCSHGDRIEATGYPLIGSYSTGENIVMGYSNGVKAQAGLLASEGHCRNIMNAGFTEVGIGTFLKVSEDTMYWTQVFAHTQP